MTKSEKILRRMRNNPRDWTTEDPKILAARYQIDWRQPGTSHVTFSRPSLAPLTVPAHKPVKSIYITRFIALIDSLSDDHDE